MPGERDLLHAIRGLWKGIPSGLPANSALARLRTNLNSAVSTRATQTSVTTLGGKVDTADTVADTINTNTGLANTGLTTLDNVLDTVNSKLTTVDTNVDDIETRVTNVDSLLRTNNNEPSSETGSMGSMVKHLAENVGGGSSSPGIALLKGASNLPGSRSFTRSLGSINDSGWSSIREISSSVPQDIYAYAATITNFTGSVFVVAVRWYTGAAGSETMISEASGYYSGVSGTNVNRSSLYNGYILMQGGTGAATPPTSHLGSLNGVNKMLLIPSGSRFSFSVSGNVSGSSPNLKVFYLTDDDVQGFKL